MTLQAYAGMSNLYVVERYFLLHCGILYVATTAINAQYYRLILRILTNLRLFITL